jgi:ADP-ribose pyrophosphatase YjhB (NUDIX family)
MSTLKSRLSTLWKWIPKAWRWRLLWLISDHFMLGVNGVVLNESNQVLLAHHVFRDTIAWGLPGGVVQRNETLEEAMRREVIEETGLTIQVQHLLQTTLETERPLLSCHFWCSVNGSPRLEVNEELFEAGFYPLDALPGPIDPGQLALIKLAIEVKTKQKPSMVVLPLSIRIDKEER